MSEYQLEGMPSLEGMPYRDDRMYVMRITSDFSKYPDGSISASMEPEENIDPEKAVVLLTYRNLLSLPMVRTDEFSSRRKAFKYIKRVEPTCPRVSLGRPPEPTPSWKQHLTWLHNQGLRSAAEGDAPLPDWVNDAIEAREMVLKSQQAPRDKRARPRRHRRK